MFFCCSDCFTEEMDEEAPLQQLGDTATVEIRNNANKSIKWISDDTKPDSLISVHFSNNDQLWKLRRKSDGLWTIHTMHDNKELFITYESSDSDLRLGYDEEDTNRYFNLVVAADGGLYLKPRKTEDNEEDRYLCIMSGKLGLSSKPSIEWEIKINGTGESEPKEKKYRVQITDTTSGKGWGCGEGDGALIKVAEAATLETWVISCQTKRSSGRAARIDYIWDIAVDQPVGKKGQPSYVTWESGETAVKLRSNVESEETKKFKVLKKTGTGAVHFLPLSNLKRFVQIRAEEDGSGEVLGTVEGDLKQAAQNATDWCVQVLGIPIDKGLNFFPC